MSERDDEDLRARFGELRALDQRDAPTFDATVRAPRRRSSPLRVVAASAPVLAAAAAILVWCARPDRHAEPPSSAPVAAAGAAGPAAGGGEVHPPPSSGESLPLDFLLEMPSGLALSLPADLDRSPADPR